jgi:nitroreductase
MQVNRRASANRRRNTNPVKAKPRGGRPILCLDFDGVLHAYRRGWQGPTTIDDEPVPGAQDFVTRAQEYFEVVVYSSRSSHPGGIQAMQEWMRHHGFPELKYATQKPAAFLTIDDRAMLFQGVWPDPQALRAFQPWTRSAAQPHPQEETSMLKDLVRKNRSVRRFQEEQAVTEATLRELVDLARLSPSGANLQPLKYLFSNTPEQNARIFPRLAWAGYLKDWPGPVEGERPAAYILILGDTAISKNFGCDHGIACQSILLGAAERGLGGCIIGSVQRAELAEDLGIPMRYEILLVLALGAPKEEVLVEPLPADGSVRYWRDDAQVHHVPKRALDDLIIDLPGE